MADHSQWQYFYDFQQGMPANCSKDVALAVNHIDTVLKFGDADEIFDLKSIFGLQQLTHNGDFTS
jgi:hypothetical protein